MRRKLPRSKCIGKGLGIILLNILTGIKERIDNRSKQGLLRRPEKAMPHKHRIIMSRIVYGQETLISGKNTCVGAKAVV